jgi:hypothetical protein
LIDRPSEVISMSVVSSLSSLEGLSKEKMVLKNIQAIDENSTSDEYTDKLVEDIESLCGMLGKIIQKENPKVSEVR